MTKILTFNYNLRSTLMERHVSMHGKKILMVGFGGIGPAVLPLILRHIEITPKQINVVAANDMNRELAEREGVKFEHFTLDEHNYQEFLSKRLNKGDLLLNLSVDVSSLDLIRLCQELGAMYVDTSIERWLSEKNVPAMLYERRETVMKEKPKFAGGPTALICHGANPGFISHLAKQAVLDIARKEKGEDFKAPKTQKEWAALGKELGVVAMHVAERDTQLSSKAREPNEYVNTWSIDGFLEEASEFTGFSWGTHEVDLPQHLVHMREDNDRIRAIELAKQGGAIAVKSWVPSGPYNGYVIPHTEAFSLAEYFNYDVDGQYSHPTVHYVYLPCNDAVSSMQEALDKNLLYPEHKRLMMDDVTEGIDELGILILRANNPEVYWYGSRLTIDEARELVPNNNATSLQVAAGVLTGVIWAIENPHEGLVEAESVDFERAITIARPYMGEFKGFWATWPGFEPKQAEPKWTFAELAVDLN
jgi:homospermidine synthase